MIGYRFTKVLLAGCVAAAFTAGATAQSNAQDFPSKPIIFVAPGTLGGGSDTQARLASNIVTDAGIFGDEPVAVLNKGGGGSQEAFTFMLSHSGDPHYLLTFQASLITYTLLGEAQYELDDFTPVANVAFDPVIVVTRPDSGWETLDEFIEACKENPESILVGGGGVAGPDRMGLIKLQEIADFTVNYIPFAGGGEIHRNLLGGHVQAAVGNPSDFMASIESGDLVGLAVLDDERGGAGPLQEVPTAKELGYDVTFGTFRGWFAAGEIEPEVMDTLQESFRAVTEHPDFKEKYADRYGMRVQYMDSEEFSGYLDEQVEVFTEILTGAGVIE